MKKRKIYKKDTSDYSDKTEKDIDGNKICIFIFIGILIFIVYKIVLSEAYIEWMNYIPPNEDYHKALKVHANPNNFIILAFVDASFTDMALNFYKTSLKPHQIDNFLFISAGQRACDVLLRMGLPCFKYREDKDTEVASLYRSPDFIRKMNIRTDMILEAIKYGFTIMHCDLDIVFVKNPIPDLEVVLKTYSMATMWDNSAYNAGFLILVPNEYTQMLYEKTRSIAQWSKTTDDQTALNIAIQKMRKKYNKKFMIIALDKKKYLCGFEYYEKANRMFAGNCKDCLVVHNNWIVSKEAKVYRFKEHHMWMVDDNKYYTNENQYYLYYGNPIIWKSFESSFNEELHALKFAFFLGKILNRIVILPKFHCHLMKSSIAGNASVGRGRRVVRKLNSISKPTNFCPINSLLLISSFDKIFGGKYREHMFLSHPLVPSSIKYANTPQYTFLAKNNADLITSIDTNLTSILVNFTAAEHLNDFDVMRYFAKKKKVPTATLR